MSVRAISKIESGQTNRPYPATLRLLTDAFGLDGAEREDFLRSATAAGSRGDLGSGHPDSAPPARGAETFVGRQRELARLRSAAVAAAEGAFQIVWIAGEDGAGKSALCRQVSAMLAREGWTTAWGGVPELPGTPSAWAWADMIERLSGTESGNGADADELLGSFMETPSGPPPTAFRLARVVVDVLRRRAVLRPMLLVLDDLHRAGDETLQILRYAATELADCPVLVAATFRPGELSPALDATRAALAGSRVDRLDLGGLDSDEVATLLAERIGVPPTTEVARVITTRTGGNPLFVGEMARLIAAEGPVAAGLVVPPNVSSMLRRRIAALPEAARNVLRIAAVVGTELDPDLLLSRPTVDPDVLLEGLEAAVGAGLLIETASGTFRFTHVLVRDAIYSDLPRLRRLRLHAEVLAALEGTHSASLAALAYHALAAAGPATARAAALKAADASRAATAVQAHQDAAVLLTTALARLEAAEAAPDLDEIRLGLLCALVSALGHAGNVLDARKYRGRAIETAGRLGRVDLLARAYISYDAPALWTLRNYQQADRELVDGVMAALAARSGSDQVTRCRLLATAAIELEADDSVYTARASEEAVTISRRVGAPELICYALNARYRYVASLSPEYWSELDDIGREQLGLATRADLRAYQTQAHHILGMAHLARNDLDGAQRHLDRAVEHATTGQLGLATGILAMFGGLRSLIAGQFDEAERRYAPVIERLRMIGNPNAEEIELLVAFCVEHARDDRDSPARMATLAEKSRPLFERLGSAVVEPYTRILIAAGDLDQARAIWTPDIPLAQDYYWFRWTALRAENALHLSDPATAHRCYRELLPWAGHLPGLLHAHVTLGPVDHTLGELAASLGYPTAAARHYADAIGVAQRLGAPHWEARSARALTAGAPAQAAATG